MMNIRYQNIKFENSEVYKNKLRFSLKSKIIVAIIFCLFGSSINGYSQSSLSITDVIPLLDVDSVGIIHPPNMTTQPFELQVCVSLSDTSIVQTVFIKIGRSVDLSDVVNVSIPFNYTSLPTGVISVTKSLNNFLVNFGTHTDIYILHLEVWAEDTSGSITQLYQKRLN